MDTISGLLASAGRELSAIEAEIVQEHLASGACGEPWATCSHGLDTQVGADAITSWCPSCGSPAPRTDRQPACLCTDPATVTLREPSGAEYARCLPHAVAAIEHVKDLPS